MKDADDILNEVLGVSEPTPKEVVVSKPVPRPSNELDDKVFLIKDKTKGPYNYVTKILRYDPKPYPGLPEDRNKIYFIGKDEAIKLINKAKYKLKTPKGSIEDFDSDNLESYMCECYKYYKDRV